MHQDSCYQNKKRHPIRAPFLIGPVITLVLLVVMLFIPGSKNTVQGDPAMKSSFEQELSQLKQLEEQQKFQAALDLVDQVIQKAKTDNQAKFWTHFLVRKVRLEMALHGYETAVRDLKEAEWPSDPVHNSVLQLYYAKTLMTYYYAYSWEINQREQVSSSSEIDLKKWTAHQIFEAANRAYAKAWQQREALDQVKVKDYHDLIVPSTFPKGIRDTLRDFGAYQWVAMLANTVTWKPGQDHDKYMLSFTELLSAPEQRAAQRDALIINPDTHPLQRLVAILDDLYFFHQSRDQAEAALETQLERIRRLSASFNRTDQTRLFINHLEKMLDDYVSFPWWAMGQYEYARLVQSTDDLIRARQIALNGYERYPDSFGGMQCHRLYKSIEAPAFSLETMTMDCPDQRSILIRHTNMERLFLRAYKVDFYDWIQRKGNYPGHFNWNEVRAVVHETQPIRQWELTLDNPGDYQQHQTYFTPDGLGIGYYVFAASARKDFSTNENKIDATMLLLTPLMTVLESSSDTWETWVLDGKTGKGIPAATVRLYSYDYNKGASLLKSYRTDQNGYCLVLYNVDKRNRNLFIVAEHGDSISFNPRYLYAYQQYKQEDRSGTFIFTDRSIYRPLQTIHFKIVLFQGNQSSAEFGSVPSQSVIVQFLDPNGQEIESKTLTSNSFGTASGSFSIPKGRILGNYRLMANYGRQPGSAMIRVEEYKRPTFEVTLEPAKDEFQMNKDARVTGTANYYFGLPVTQGSVTYRVTREPVLPRWYWWYYNAYRSSARVVELTAGKAALKEDGSFAITFTPTADPDIPGQESLSYYFKVHVSVTDDGGETREAQSIYRIGFRGIETRISLSQNFLENGEQGQVTLMRLNMNGVAQPGQGSYSVVRLVQPEQVQLPSEIPLAVPEGRKSIGGDHLRPRWEETVPLEQTLYSWPDGPVMVRSDVQHGTDGIASVVVPGLEAGAYRIKYVTRDKWGIECPAQYEFVVGHQAGPLAVPFFLLAKSTSVQVGDTASFYCGSGLADQNFYFELYQSGKLLKRDLLSSRTGSHLITIPVDERYRGGFSVRLFGLHDVHFYEYNQSISVPWDNKELKLDFKTFRDTLRPGQQEKWIVTVKGPHNEKVAAEIVSYMYDRSLDYFTGHSYPSLGSLYPSRFYLSMIQTNLGHQPAQSILHEQWYSLPSVKSIEASQFIELNDYGIGGPGRRRFSGMGYAITGAEMDEKRDMSMLKSAALPEVNAPKSEEASLSEQSGIEGGVGDASSGSAPEQPIELRSDFSETAFFLPHLVTDDQGEVQIEFDVPDSVTAWKVYVHALTRDLKFMSLQKETATIKELMVRPYLPRFMREGDQALLKVVVNNASDRTLQGKVSLQVIDPLTEKDCSADFGLTGQTHEFSALARQSNTISWSLHAPGHLGNYAVKVIATTGGLSDGELRPFPVLPSRFHLVQSRFATLKENESRVLELPDLAEAASDRTLVHDKFVVTLDSQLIYTVLKALPYLTNYPYECVEQTLNRFLSTSIVTSLYDHYPVIRDMARKFSRRETKLEPWQLEDPNRSMSLEETPWLVEARGGDDLPEDLINVLDERIARGQMQSALDKLRKAQLRDGSFPWWEGGPPSPYMTLYLMYGFAKAAEFEVEIPRDMVRKSWKYLYDYYQDYYAKKMLIEDFGYEFITFLNYVLTCYPDDSYFKGSFSRAERETMLDFSFRYWQDHNPYMKGYLSLTLFRMDRNKEALLVLDSIMDSAITKEDQGTFWAREDRSWLWYNDTIESHAFILRVLQEVKPDDSRIDGLILWLLLNKKFNQWKSTRTTAEVVYSLVTTLKNQGALGVQEKATVRLGPQTHTFVFEPDQYTGANNQVIVRGENIVPETMSRTTVEKEGKGYLFASVTWHYSTEKLPDEARGDYLSVRREYYLRKNQGKEMVLVPLDEGIELKTGDQVEVHLSISAKHPMEYVHLRDPRGAGFEPEKQVSGHRWDLGISWYEEIRDSGTNFFFEWLPQGEYTFKYRLRTAMAGTFRIHPATLQSMYAPEFAAFSSGQAISIRDNTGSVRAE
ncbi:hypothetical protein JXQ70_12420 [bacterium]|nr:hypothetical protein [bacterium]